MAALCEPHTEKASELSAFGYDATNYISKKNNGISKKKKQQTNSLTHQSKYMVMHQPKASLKHIMHANTHPRRPQHPVDIHIITPHVRTTLQSMHTHTTQVHAIVSDTTNLRMSVKQTTT